MAKQKHDLPDRRADLALLDSLRREHDLLTRALGAKATADGEPNTAQHRLAVVKGEMTQLRQKHGLDDAKPAAVEGEKK